MRPLHYAMVIMYRNFLRCLKAETLGACSHQIDEHRNALFRDRAVVSHIPGGVRDFNYLLADLLVCLYSKGKSLENNLSGLIQPGGQLRRREVFQRSSLCDLIQHFIEVSIDVRGQNHLVDTLHHESQGNMEWEMEHRPNLLADRAEVLTAEVVEVELVNKVLFKEISGGSSQECLGISRGGERRKQSRQCRSK